MSSGITPVVDVEVKTVRTGCQAADVKGAGADSSTAEGVDGYSGEPPF